MIQALSVNNGFCFSTFLGAMILKGVQFISKPFVVGVERCTVYKGRCTWRVWEGVQFIREGVHFLKYFIINSLWNNTQHNFKQESVTTSLYLVHLSLIKPYKGVHLGDQKVYKKTTTKPEVITFGI